MLPMPEAYFRSPRKLIGRISELAFVSKTLEEPGGANPVILFEGLGGIGKTRLLTEVRALCQEHDDLLCTQVIDLYLTRYHQPTRILLGIATQLRQDAARRNMGEQLFAGFMAALETAYSSTDEGSDELRRRVEQIFLKEYAAVAQRRRIVLLIDTLEKIHPTIPGTQDFDFRASGRLETWLADLLAVLPNTFVLLAGRPRDAQQRLFKGVLGSRLKVFTVEPFTPEETAEYITSEFTDLGTKEAQQIDALHQLSAGRPVVLAIALACAGRGVIDIDALPAEFGQQYPENRDQLSERFVRLIVEDLQYNSPVLSQMLARAVYLRKGLRLPLLMKVVADEGDTISEEEIGAQLDELASYVFVKRIDEREILLHDEMYELLLNKIGGQQASGWWKSAIAYLDHQIANAAVELQTAIRSGGRTSQGYARIRQKLQTLRVERMFYLMSDDLRRGYQNYRELSSNAIASHDDDFDAQLQEELARFFDPETTWGQIYQQRLRTSGLSWEQIVYDEGIRWVYRRINTHIPGKDRYLEAVELAEHIRARHQDIYHSSQLARCDLDAAKLQAEVYIPDKAPDGATIAENYKLLTATLSTIVADTNAKDADGAYARFILANAYNYWGYFERVNERLDSATQKYRSAIELYRKLGTEVDGLLAVTMNNLGYALGRQGESDRGLAFLEGSLKLVDRIGSVYRAATTINTSAHLYADTNRNAQALECVLKAKQLFSQFDSLRANALNANAEGRIRSRIADKQDDAAKRDAEYQQAVTAYRHAIEGFDIEGERARSIEIRSSLAKTLRDWASVSEEAVADVRRDEALRLLAEALQLCSEKTPRVTRCSILEATAAILVDKGLYVSALQMLDQARQLLPASIQSPAEFKPLGETLELRLYWLRFAQIQLQYAFCAIGQGRQEDTCAHLLLSFAGLGAFSKDASPVERFERLARQAVLSIDDRAAIDQLLKLTPAIASRLNVPPQAPEIVLGLLSKASETLEDRDLLRF